MIISWPHYQVKCRLENKIISELFIFENFDNRIVTFLPGQSLSPVQYVTRPKLSGFIYRHVDLLTYTISAFHVFTQKFFLFFPCFVCFWSSQNVNWRSNFGSKSNKGMDRKSTKHKGGDFCYLFLEHEEVFDIGNLSIIKIAKISKFSSYPEYKGLSTM